METTFCQIKVISVNKSVLFSLIETQQLLVSDRRAIQLPDKFIGFINSF